MASLHAALKSLAPLSFSEVPEATEQREEYLSKLFLDCQLILESIPIGPPDESSTRQRSKTTSSVASNVSEMSASSARSAPPPHEFQDLQKEWGKPIKLSAKENPLGISVHKLSGKDGKGAWFARRSVHEGLGFARFKKGLEKEFPESLAVEGGPGEGNIRGIGGEKKIEDFQVPGKGRVEVFLLSAQFPGPTTPRDFVTMLVTSSKAMKEDQQHSTIPEIAPRHYMIVSKPCNHPKAQPRDGFIRGHYESVEFIREVPRKQNRDRGATTSSDELPKSSQGRNSPSLEHQVLSRNAEKRTHTFPLHHENRSTDGVQEKHHLHIGKERAASREPSPGARKRSVTVGVPDSANHPHKDQGSQAEHYDPEENPVEWIMITRSDPGGSVPRFMVERGTPSSIVADASKFLDWACQKEHSEEELQAESPTASPKPKAKRQESFSSWQANGTLAGVREQAREQQQVVAKEESANAAEEPKAEPFPELSRPSTAESPTPQVRSELSEASSPLSSSGILASMTGAVSSTIGAYAPQAVLDHLPNSMTPSKSASSPALVAPKEDRAPPSYSTPDLQPPGSRSTTKPSAIDDDAASSMSSLTFASADSHFASDEDEAAPSLSSKSSPEKDLDKPAVDKAKPTASEKEISRFADRKASLDAKLAEAKTKYAKDASTQQEKVRKAEEKHAREVSREKERHEKQLAKLEEKRVQELKKGEERRRKEEEKDEKVKLTRQRDEAIKESQGLKKQLDIMTKQVGELQKENTALMARIGKLEGVANNKGGEVAGAGIGAGGVGVGVSGGVTPASPPKPMLPELSKLVEDEKRRKINDLENSSPTRSRSESLRKVKEAILGEGSS